MRCLKCLQSVNKKDSFYGLHKECFLEWFRLEQLSEFMDVVRKDSDSGGVDSEDLREFNSSFFQGKFRKYSASLGSYDYILKVEENDYPELPATEFLCNQIAEFMKIKVPEFYLIDFYGKITFVSKSFINRNSISTLHHIYHFIKEGEPFNVSTVVRIINEQTGRLSEVERFVTLTLFDSLIGNHDRHGRNLAFLEDENGKKMLSPFYDNPSYIGTEEEMLLVAQHSPKGRIATSETNEPSMADYLKEFLEMGYSSTVENFYKRLNIDKIEEMIESSHLCKKRKKAFFRIVKNRYEEMNNVLGK